jgi:hypothetical protein
LWRVDPLLSNDSVNKTHATIEQQCCNPFLGNRSVNTSTTIQ